MRVWISSPVNMKMLIFLALAAFVAADPEAKADAEADPYYYGGYGYGGYGLRSYGGYGYGGYGRGYYGGYRGYYGKREAEAEPEAKAEADPYYYGGYGRSYGYGLRSYGGYGYYGGYGRGYYGYGY